MVHVVSAPLLLLFLSVPDFVVSPRSEAWRLPYLKVLSLENLASPLPWVIEGKGDVTQLSDWGPEKLMLSQRQTDPSSLPSSHRSFPHHQERGGAASPNLAKVPFLHFLCGLPPHPLPRWQETPRDDSVTLSQMRGEPAIMHGRPAVWSQVFKT